MPLTKPTLSVGNPRGGRARSSWAPSGGNTLETVPGEAGRCEWFWGVLAFPLAKIAEAHRVSEDSHLRGEARAGGHLSCVRVQMMQADRTPTRGRRWRDPCRGRSPAPERPRVTVSNLRARTTGAKCARPTHCRPAAPGFLPRSTTRRPGSIQGFTQA